MRDTRLFQAVFQCSGCGYGLYGLGVSRCPECNRGFDSSNPSTFVSVVCHAKPIFHTACRASLATISPAAFFLIVWATPRILPPFDVILEGGTFFVGLTVCIGGPMYGWIVATDLLDELSRNKRHGRLRYDYPAPARVAVTLLRLVKWWPALLLLIPVALVCCLLTSRFF